MGKKWHSHAGSCSGKIAFESPRLAHEVGGRKNGMSKRSVYRCSTCGKWHLGSSLRVSPKRMMLDRARVEEDISGRTPWLNWR